jgi:hypothetical protein
MKVAIELTASDDDGTIIGGWLTVDGVTSELTDELLDLSITDLVENMVEDSDDDDIAPYIAPTTLTAERAAEIDRFLFEDAETGEPVGIVSEATAYEPEEEDEDGDQ